MGRDAITFTYLPADDLVRHHLHDPASRVEYRNIVSASRSCFALFSNGHVAGKNGMTGEYLIPDRGIILSTGHPFEFGGNDSGETTTDFREDTGEPGLRSQLSDGSRIFDHCFIEFDFQCTAESKSGGHTVGLDYVFGSDEYEGAGAASGNDDIFGVFLNGKNVALVPGGGAAPISVNNVNGRTNSEYFVENALTGRINRTSPYQAVEADGFTTRLRAEDAARPGWNSIKLVVGDAGDGSLDSWALLGAGSFSCAATVVAAPETPNLRSPSNPTGPVDAPAASPPDSREKTYNLPGGINITAPEAALPYQNIDRPWQMSKDVAVGLLVMFGVIALAMPCVALASYKKRVADAGGDDAGKK